MAQIVSDDFNRANSTGLGANWTDVTNGFNVSSNQATARTASSDNQSVYTGAAWTGGNDHYAEITAIQKDAGDDCGPIARSSSGAETFYYFSINWNDTAATLGSALNCTVFKVTAGTFTQIGSGTSFVVSAGDVLRIEVQGSAPATVTCKLNGTTKITQTDSTIGTGNPGIFSFGTVVTFDNFAAGDFSAGGTTSHLLSLMGVGG